MVTEKVEYKGYEGEMALIEKVRANLPLIGEWVNEPDYLKVKDNKTKYTILIRRAPSGALCGYVGVNSNSSLFAKNYQDCLHPLSRVPTEEEIEEKTRFMEGFMADGIEFSAFPDSIKAGIRADFVTRLLCHDGSDSCEHQLNSIFKAHGGITFSGLFESIGDGIWYIGFDCSHAGDSTPIFDALSLTPGYRKILKTDVYRNLDYVFNEALNLAQQIHDYEEYGVLDN